MARLEIALTVGRRQAAWLMAAALLAVTAQETGSERLTVTTYYPAPAGVYRRLTTTGRTFLARDAESVGIGTTSPLAKLDVNGTARAGQLQAAARAGPEGACDDQTRGTIYYRSSDNMPYVCRGAGLGWKPLIAAISCDWDGAKTLGFPANACNPTGGCVVTGPIIELVCEDGQVTRIGSPGDACQECMPLGGG